MNMKLKNINFDEFKKDIEEVRDRIGKRTGRRRLLTSSKNKKCN